VRPKLKTKTNDDVELNQHLVDRTEHCGTGSLPSVHFAYSFAQMAVFAVVPTPYKLSSPKEVAECRVGYRYLLILQATAKNY
jgi:hypothetical protein